MGVAIISLIVGVIIFKVIDWVQKISCVKNRIDELKEEIKALENKID